MTKESKSSFWRDAKKELPKRTKGVYSDVDVFVLRTFRSDIGRTLNNNWVNIKNEPLNDVVLWAYMPVVPKSLRKCFD